MNLHGMKVKTYLGHSYKYSHDSHLSSKIKIFCIEEATGNKRIDSIAVHAVTLRCYYSYEWSGNYIPPFDMGDEETKLTLSIIALG